MYAERTFAVLNHRHKGFICREIKLGDIEIMEYANEYASGDLIIPDKIRGRSVTTIGNSAFYLCRKLTDVTIPEDLISIGGNAFAWCDSLTHITIPSSVTSIGYGAFDAAWTLEKIAIYNPECEIDPDKSTICDEAVIYGYKGSTAQAWAKEHNRTFRLIDEYVPD